MNHFPGIIYISTQAKLIINHTCPQYISRKLIKSELYLYTDEFSMHVFSADFVSDLVICIFMHCLEGFLNPSLNIQLFHLSMDFFSQE